jgi:hypothetical protein
MRRLLRTEQERTSIETRSVYHNLIRIAVRFIDRSFGNTSPHVSIVVSRMAEAQGACKDAALQLVTCMEARSPCVKAGGTVSDCLKQDGAMEGCEVRHGRDAG